MQAKIFHFSIADSVGGVYNRRVTTESGRREEAGPVNGLGLVFAGGGGKGAYQIGVWRYLREVGLDRSVSAVSGTSVGALNAALFASGDFERAERIWRNIQPELILSPPSYSVAEVTAWMAESGITAASGDRALPSAAALAPAMESALGGSLPFSREGLLWLMREGVDFDAIRRAPIPCYATCLTVPGLELRRFDLRQYPAEDARTLLLATSAIPLVFENVEFEGERYCDGGVPFVGDNIPVEPVASLGVPYILVVNLSQEAILQRERFPDVKLIEITPHEDLGNLVTGTLDFTPDGAARRIELGYEDTRRALGGFVEAARIHQQSELIFQAFEESERAYRDQAAMERAQQRTSSDPWDRESYEEMWEDFTAASGEPEAALQSAGSTA